VFERSGHANTIKATLFTQNGAISHVPGSSQRASGFDQRGWTARVERVHLVTDNIDKMEIRIYTRPRRTGNGAGLENMGIKSSHRVYLGLDDGILLGKALHWNSGGITGRPGLCFFLGIAAIWVVGMGLQGWASFRVEHGKDKISCQRMNQILTYIVACVV